MCIRDRSVQHLSEIEQSPAELLIILRIFEHVMSRRDLTFDLLTLNLYSTSSVLCLNSVQNLSEIELSTAELLTILHVFACNFRGWVRTDRTFSGVRGPNFTKLGDDIGRSSQHCTFVSEFRYLATFSNAGGSNLSDVSNYAKFRTFRPPVKIKGGVGEIPIPLVEALRTTEPPKYI